MTPLRSCDDINGFCDGIEYITVTEESGLFMDKTPPCDDSDGNIDIIPTSYEGDATQPQLGEYENNTDNTATPSHPAQNTCKTQHYNCDDIEYITVTDTTTLAQKRPRPGRRAKRSFARVFARCKGL